MASAKEQILALIPKLRAQDLRDVSAAIKVMETLHGGSDQPDLITDWLLSGIITYLAGAGWISSKGAVWDLRRRKSYQVYKRKLPDVMQYLVSIEKQANTRTRHRPKLAFLCARALVELLEQRNIMSVNAVLTQIDKLPEALNKAFPGYAPAGLFSFVLNLYEDK